MRLLIFVWTLGDVIALIVLGLFLAAALISFVVAIIPVFWNWLYRILAAAKAKAMSLPPLYWVVIAIALAWVGYSLYQILNR